jgi:adenosylcobinamide-phosphate synthase
MVGYRNERYELFGRASAKADDVLNFVPARLSVLIISVAGFVKGVTFAKTFDVVKRFRRSHESPNSAHSMSAFAGVLDVTLGGAVSYFGELKEKPYIGDGKRELTPELINEAVNLYKTSALIALMVLACLPLMWIVL